MIHFHLSHPSACLSAPLRNSNISKTMRNFTNKFYKRTMRIDSRVTRTPLENGLNSLKLKSTFLQDETENRATDNIFTVLAHCIFIAWSERKYQVLLCLQIGAVGHCNAPVWSPPIARSIKKNNHPPLKSFYGDDNYISSG